MSVRLRDPRVLLPIGVLALSLVLAAVMMAARTPVATEPPEVVPPLVRVIDVTPRDLRLTVQTQGTVVPRTQSTLVPEVGGRIVWTSPALAAGGFFAADEPLVRLDRADAEVRLARAEATAAAARSQAQLARRNGARSRELAQQGIVSAMTLDDAENAERVATATQREAEAALDQARRDLERTELRAPFAGRVREKLVDVGQFVDRGTPLATLYAVDWAEVRLPVADTDLAFLDLRLDHRGDAQAQAGPEVELRADFAGRTHRWRGRIVRTEGEIDPQSRMVHAVARVEDPYGRGEDPERPPLAVGLFVQAEIVGRDVPNAITLPRAALRGADQVLVVGPDDRLDVRTVKVLRRDRHGVVVADGLAPGERVCVSPLEAAVDGMPVRTVAETPS